MLVAHMEKFSAWLQSSSFRPFGMVYGCCRPEFDIAKSSVYDWQRLGAIDVDEVEEADLLVVGGWLNPSLANEVRHAYEKMKKPCSVIAIGACAVSGSPFQLSKSEIVKASDILPVDVYVPGCPPRPEMFLEAILKLKKKIQPDADQKQVLQEAMKKSPIGQ